jgi:hypothetical protein
VTRDSLLLLLLAARHYGYYHLPDAWHSGAFAVLGSLALIACIVASQLPRILKAWAIGEEAMVAGCTAAWVAWPWPASEELCSDQIGLKLGVIGVAWLALAMWAANRTSVQVTGGGK